MSEVQLHHGDCLDVLPTLDADSIDAVVTDPPYGLSFMGKAWDKGVPSVDVWREVLRVLKPGGHLLAFAGTRTQHRMASAIEDAGFEVRDMIMWHYGQGFPKSKNLGNGFGSALKPATEPITMARKPFKGSLEANYEKYGTGAINVDGCRVEMGDEYDPSKKQRQQNSSGAIDGAFGASSLIGNEIATYKPGGRWPANLIHDGSDEVTRLFPVTGASKASERGLQHSGRHGGLADIGGNIKNETNGVRGHNDNGGLAARFFYQAKASKRDRNEGLPEGTTSTHPTVKPTDLMRYLVRLVTPPGGTVLDPFTGSGSTGKAAGIEGFSFIGIELDEEYVKIAKARIAKVHEQGRLF